MQTVKKLVQEAKKKHSFDQQQKEEIIEVKSDSSKCESETGFTVDAFSYGDVPGCTGYILSHFHYDHYNGLTKHFTNPIYCSQITANLVLSRIKLKEEFVHPIPMNTPCLIDNIEITMLEANHCPGSVLILFRLPSGRVILHTGDFRADKSMEDYPEFKGVKFSQLYLDTTYCNPTYDFPPQKEVIDFAVDLVKKELARNPKTLIVCGSYTIGKERIFIAIAQALGCKICVYKDKQNVMSCLDDSDLFQKLSLDFNDSQLHVLQLGKLNPKGLGIHMSNLKTKYSNVIALEPTGWSYGKINSLQEIKPKYNRDGIKIFGIPYSEHSSYLEMKQFVQFIKPERIIPTVNNGNPKARKKMEDIFKSWFQELQQGQGQQAKVTVKQSSISTWFA
ncbi:hypothetical protein FSP39_008281 [Pinctada imbricata]|uniref:DNA cross-link repair 1A protein n=1 Tax=Pinctada imbricata TaxID=66713 RepID=A0AA89BT93_PINIB|nr:hypothetical protein FSP39_008281 [Pinctada imbricata]